ncbi:hypothetical protein IF1G_07996 [Cordyceps javanica]|uniref:Uncharacterized protein n=1 Tax=Cordyceps javanica TaxID=43265 RepID=A0A545UVD0_9HYPO|nr:hypothetical protein IF1G_07996 [Cordyceps javanica]
MKYLRTFKRRFVAVTVGDPVPALLFWIPSPDDFSSDADRNTCAKQHSFTSQSIWMRTSNRTNSSHSRSILARELPRWIPSGSWDAEPILPRISYIFSTSNDHLHDLARAESAVFMLDRRISDDTILQTEGPDRTPSRVPPRVADEQ